MKKNIVSIALALILMALTSTTAFAATLPEDQINITDDIVAAQLTDDQLNKELGETIKEIEMLLGDGSDGIIDGLIVDIDNVLGEAEDLLDEAETDSEAAAPHSNPEQQLSKEDREQRLNAKLEKLKNLMAEREARIAAKNQRVEAADASQSERQAVKDAKVAAADERQAERQAEAKSGIIAAADERQVNRQGAVGEKVTAADERQAKRQAGRE